MTTLVPAYFFYCVCVYIHTNGRPTVFVVVTNKRPTAGVRHISLTRTLASLFSNFQKLFRVPYSIWFSFLPLSLGIHFFFAPFY
jgi:hypothetical protein